MHRTSKEWKPRKFSRKQTIISPSDHFHRYTTHYSSLPLTRDCSQIWLERFARLEMFYLFIKVHILPSLADLLSSFRKNIEIKSVLARMLQKFISNVSFSWKRIIYLINLFISLNQMQALPKHPRLIDLHASWKTVARNISFLAALTFCSFWSWTSSGQMC